MCEGATEGSVSPSGGDATRREIVNQERMKRIAWRNAPARVGWTNSYVPLVAAYWYVFLPLHVDIQHRCTSSFIKHWKGEKVSHVSKSSEVFIEMAIQDYSLLSGY